MAIIRGTKPHLKRIYIQQIKISIPALLKVGMFLNLETSQRSLALNDKEGQINSKEVFDCITSERCRRLDFAVDVVSLSCTYGNIIFT